jgi:hypothetical protein
MASMVWNQSHQEMDRFIRGLEAGPGCCSLPEAWGAPEGTVGVVMREQV